MAILTIDGVAIPDPSALTWGIQDISSDDSGRGQDLRMHKGVLGRARTLQLQWNAVTPDVASQVLQAVAPEEFDVTYFDAEAGAVQTRTFYVGDRTAMMKQWFGSGPTDYSGKNLWGQISFNIIEVDPERT